MGTSAALVLAAAVVFVVAARSGMAVLARFKAWLQKERPGVHQELSVLPALTDRRVARFLIKRFYLAHDDEELRRVAEIARAQLVGMLGVMALAVGGALYALWI